MVVSVETEFIMNEFWNISTLLLFYSSTNLHNSFLFHIVIIIISIGGLIFSVIGIQTCIIVHWNSIFNFLHHLTPFSFCLVQESLHAWDGGPHISLCQSLCHNNFLTFHF